MTTDKGFIFDMDGVIVNTEPLYLDNVRDILTELNVEITDEELYSYVGISSPKMWQILKARYGLPQDVCWLVDTEQSRVLSTFQEMDSLEPIAGIPTLIEFLQQNHIKIGLASSSLRRNVDLILQGLRLTDCFEATVSGEEVSNGKPHPEIFLACAAKLRIQPDRCLVLEDSPHGITGANLAQMTTIGFVNPHSGNQDLTHADHVAAKIDGELYDFIRAAL